MIIEVMKLRGGRKMVVEETDNGRCTIVSRYVYNKDGEWLYTTVCSVDRPMTEQWGSTYQSE